MGPRDWWKDATGHDDVTIEHVNSVTRLWLDKTKTTARKSNFGYLACFFSSLTSQSNLRFVRTNRSQQGGTPLGVSAAKRSVTPCCKNDDLPKAAQFHQHQSP